MPNRKVEQWILKKKDHRKGLNPKHLFDGIRIGDISSLSAGITLIESQHADHKELANELISLCLSYSGKSVRVGITGVPGVGKSTFIETFGKILLQKNKKVAVLAVDPSSSVSGGSILADKTRMQDLSMMKNVFIRPSAAGTTLGGVARKTRESIILCEAAGFDYILIETVGVGQSETVVKSMVDFFLLLMLSGAGDELQGIKKGIMEMADAVVITKADGDNILKSNKAAAEYKLALHLFPPNQNEWIPQVFTCSSQTGENIGKVYEVISSFVNQVTLNGYFEKNRRKQDKIWLDETLKEMILAAFFNDKELLKRLNEFEILVSEGKLTSFQAADQLFTLFNKKKNGGKI